VQDTQRTTHRGGLGGTVNGYGVPVRGDVVVVRRGAAEVARSRWEGLGRFVAEARDLKLGWGQFPDNAGVIFLYDKGDNCFGYALNLACDWCGEWGYVPVGA
jgi:hypothetical protein